MTTLNSRRICLTSLNGFLLPISPVVTWFPEHNSSVGWTSVFQCSVLPSPTEVQTNTFLHNPPLFSKPLHLHFTLSESWKLSQQIDSSCMNSSYICLCFPSSHKPDDKPNKDRYFTQQPSILMGVTRYCK